MPKFTRSDAQYILDSVMNAGTEKLEAVSCVLDSVETLNDNLTAISTEDNKVEMSQIYGAVLDGALDYKAQHGKLPDAALVASALNQAATTLDDAVNSATSQAHSPTAFVPMQPIVGIRTMIATGVPFAHYINADKLSGEGSVIIVSHNTATKTGMYEEGGSLNGMQGGYTFVSPERKHKLTSSDNLTFTGKITPIQTQFDECDQNADAHPLYPNSTEIYVNGLNAVPFTQGKGESETAAVIFELGGVQYNLNAQVNIKAGEVKVVSDKPLPENTEITAKGYLNVEADGFKTPSVRIDGEKYPFKAKNYRAKVTVTPEAARQFADEIGIDPAFEGVVAIRNQMQQEILFNLLDELVSIGSRVNNSQYDFNWVMQGNEKTQATIAEDLLGHIETISKKMAKLNGSHGISHIYVGERLASIFTSLGEKYFESSGITARASVYRLGRLKSSNIEVYYTPKGLRKDNAPEKSDRILAIGASAANPAFNPVILGEVSAPNVEAISATKDTPDKGYWVTGRRIVAQNPVKQYAASAAIIDCINMAY